MYAPSTARAAAVAVAAVMAVPAVATAHLPRTDSTLIVPGKGMAGVRIGMTKNQVFGKWGDTHCSQGLCTWEGPGSPEHREVASVYFKNGAVDTISIKAGTRGSNSRFNPGFLSDWETKKHIHLGLPKGKVKKAYPNAKANNGEAVNGFDLFTGSGPNTRYTRFSAFSIGASKNHLNGISIQWDVCHYYPPDCRGR